MLVELYPPNVRALRQEWGMSAAALAEAAGVTAPTARGQRSRRGSPRGVAPDRREPSGPGPSGLGLLVSVEILMDST
jgi:hypothetical protein